MEALRPPRNKTPVLLQMEATECGAAALGIILAYYKRIVPIAELRSECGVSRDGSRASNVVKAARRYGLKAKGLSKDNDSVRELQTPYVIFWNFNHFLVVEGFGREKVYLNDPAAGHRTVSIKEFEENFSGVVLYMEPGDDFVEGGKSPSLTAALKRRIQGSYAPLSLCMLIGFLLVLPGLALPAFSQIFIDHVILENRQDWVRPLVFAMFIAIFTTAALRFLQLRYFRRLMISLSVRMGSEFFWHLLKLPTQFYDQRFSGEIATRSQLNDELADVLSGELAQTVIDVVMVVFYAAMMIWYDVPLTMIGIAFAVSNILLLRFIAARRIEATMRIMQDAGKATGTAVAGLKSIETIKASGLESDFFSRWAGQYTKSINAGQDLQVANISLGVLPTLLSATTTVAILMIGGFRVIDGELTIGMLVAFQALMAAFLGPVNNLVNLGSTMQDLRANLTRVDDVLQHPTETELAAEELTDAEGAPVYKLKGHVELRDICFGYNPLEKPLIENFNLKLNPGERVALVGASGSGKSTIAKLIRGDYQAWSGEVLFDDVDRRRVPSAVLANSFASVSQEIALFGASVRDNLTLWDDTIPLQDIRRAAEDAAIDEKVKELKAEYESELFEGGVNLSGGQQQRMEIARALVGNPSILVLDEATSALDVETENVIMQRLRMRGCACVIIAHRLSTIRDCDEIIVMQAGKIVERGTHEVLYAANGVYTELMQSSGNIAVAAAAGSA
ncbi:MAG: NHLP family bacteriocin export ABC transporter peptidase/permease/ATPase subunit [Gammaproteobacteria bacterium]|nr:NHLP family bacteriocin export ABC transporter peptidase/permease/ATPase subunit [Gammaproteobacteria bacterium]